MLRLMPASRRRVPPTPLILQASYTEARLTTKEFLDVSTKLFADMKVWIAEA